MNKYEIVSGWYNQANSWVEGASEFETIEELIEAYKNKKDNSKVIRICLTCEYSNSLDYMVREQQQKLDYIELNNKLIENGIKDDFTSRRAGIQIKSKTA